MEATKEQINEAATVIREHIDDLWERLADGVEGDDDADSKTNHLYDAVTLLHEQAMKGVS